jgi:hypothetical protein
MSFIIKAGPLIDKSIAVPASECAKNKYQTDISFLKSTSFRTGIF